MVEPQPVWSLHESSSDIFGVMASPDNSSIACALSNGQVSLHSYATGRLSYTLSQSGTDFATTSLRFNKRLPRTFIAISADGFIRGWSTHKGALQWSVQETANQLFALDIGPECDKFATAGIDKKIRIYDYERREVVSVLGADGEVDEENPGHTNRIFSLLFKDSSTMFSAGWDDSIYVWDLREGRSVLSMFGAHVCSDTLDFHGDTLVSGSWRTHDQVQLWDIRNFKQKRVLNWKAERQCLVYATRFHPSGEFVAVGGSGACEVRLLNVKTGDVIGQPLKFDSTVYSLCFASEATQMIVGTQKGGLSCYNLKKH